MNKEQLHKDYDRISRTFFDVLYTYWPPHATRQGFHQYDDSLGHYRRDEIETTLRTMKQLQVELVNIKPENMDPPYALDYPVLETRMKREIYWIEKWRFWERNPLFYKNLIMEGIFNLLSRDFAPLEDRLRSVIAREKDVIEVLACARENLTNPPVEYTQQAIDQLPGAIAFFNKLQAEFADVKDRRLLLEFKAANNRVMDELKHFHLFFARRDPPQL